MGRGGGEFAGSFLEKGDVFDETALKGENADCDAHLYCLCVVAFDGLGCEAMCVSVSCGDDVERMDSE